MVEEEKKVRKKLFEEIEIKKEVERAKSGFIYFFNLMIIPALAVSAVHYFLGNIITLILLVAILGCMAFFLVGCLAMQYKSNKVQKVINELGTKWFHITIKKIRKEEENEY